MHTQNSDSPRIRVFPQPLSVATLLLGIAIHFIHPVMLSPQLFLRSLGTTLTVAACVTGFSARSEMLKSGTNVNPDKPATEVVTRGPFRFSRNPMYFSFCLLNCGIGFLLCDAVVVSLTLALMVILHFAVVLREERYLQAKFGEEYLIYCRSVRRWL